MRRIIGRPSHSLGVVQKSAKNLWLTPFVFLGAAVAGAGVGLWTTARRTVTTIFETMMSGEERGPMCGNIDWVDKEFLLHKGIAAGVVLGGFCIVLGAVFFMVWKNDELALQLRLLRQAADREFEISERTEYPGDGQS